MQDIMPPPGVNAQVIQSYGASAFRIGNVLYSHAVLVMPEQTLAWSGEWTEAALSPLFSALPPLEVLLIGTGKRHEMLDPALRAVLKRHGLSLDTMDTGAACRTFNILLAEGRRVAAALRLPA